jgi:hypothetical protein
MCPTCRCEPIKLMTRIGAASTWFDRFIWV